MSTTPVGPATSAVPQGGGGLGSLAVTVLTTGAAAAFGTVITMGAAWLGAAFASGEISVRSLLSRYTIDLSQSVQEKPPEVFERESELGRLGEIFSLDHPTGVILSGKSGVGKSAIVEEFACRASRGEIQELKKKKVFVYRANLAAMYGQKGAKAFFQDMISGQSQRLLRDLFLEVAALNRQNPDQFHILYFDDELLENIGIDAFDSYFKELFSQEKIGFIASTANQDLLDQWARKEENTTGMARRMTTLQIEAPEHEKMMKILSQKADCLSRKFQCTLEISQDEIAKILEESSAYGGQPAAALRALEEICSMVVGRQLDDSGCVEAGEEQTESDTRYSVTKEVIKNYFQRMEQTSSPAVKAKLAKLKSRKRVRDSFLSYYLPVQPKFLKEPSSRIKDFVEQLKSLLGGGQRGLVSSSRPSMVSLESYAMTLRMISEWRRGQTLRECSIETLLRLFETGDAEDQEFYLTVLKSHLDGVKERGEVLVVRDLAKLLPFLDAAGEAEPTRQEAYSLFDFSGLQGGQVSFLSQKAMKFAAPYLKVLNVDPERGSSTEGREKAGKKTSNGQAPYIAYLLEYLATSPHCVLVASEEERKSIAATQWGRENPSFQSKQPLTPKEMVEELHSLCGVEKELLSKLVNAVIQLTGTNSSIPIFDVCYQVILRCQHQGDFSLAKISKILEGLFEGAVSQEQIFPLLQELPDSFSLEKREGGHNAFSEIAHFSKPLAQALNSTSESSVIWVEDSSPEVRRFLQEKIGQTQGTCLLHARGLKYLRSSVIEKELSDLKVRVLREQVKRVVLEEDDLESCPRFKEWLLQLCKESQVQVVCLSSKMSQRFDKSAAAEPQQQGGLVSQVVQTGVQAVKSLAQELLPAEAERAPLPPKIHDWTGVANRVIPIGRLNEEQFSLWIDSFLKDSVWKDQIKSVCKEWYFLEDATYPATVDQIRKGLEELLKSEIRSEEDLLSLLERQVVGYLSAQEVQYCLAPSKVSSTYRAYRFVKSFHQHFIGKILNFSGSVIGSILWKIFNVNLWTRLLTKLF